MDYQFNSNWRLTGRYMCHTNKATLPYGIGGWLVRSNLDNIDVTSDVPSQILLGSSTGIINNTTSIELSFGRDAGGAPTLGLHRADDPAAVADVSACLLVAPPVNGLLATLRAFFLTGPGRDDAAAAAGTEARVVVRASADASQAFSLR